ncbi:hypothetical protein NQ315_002718 [Exocentrus adspersus]|uniref:Tyr recombinase domain-containing protein n=1 Tax=Exocentrus adspersus TaxID=1586481 RepID=A0AAV8VI96_9CUCU|nr:hypothetical protein NQ315_002718 [Exocentrus adspersus]
MSEWSLCGPVGTVLFSYVALICALFSTITGQRIQTISLIRVENIKESQAGFQINIADRIKTTGTNKPQPCLQVPYFGSNPALCGGSTLKAYIAATKPLRRNDQEFLFLTTRPPHGIATKQTISRWVKTTLHAAGINTDVFKPHSTRHASTSAALERGCYIKNKEVHVNFRYNRKCQTDAIILVRKIMPENP